MIAALFCGLFYGAFVLSAVQEMERIRRRELVKRIKQALETYPEPDVPDAVNWSWETFFDCRGPEPHNCTCDPCTCRESTTTITHTRYEDG